MRPFPAVFLTLALAGCGSSSPTPSTPTGGTPATPTPAPTTTPTPVASANACNPLPPKDKFYGFHVKVQVDQGNKRILNASPLVADPAYCASIGIVAEFCETRYEDDPQRPACDDYISGVSNTGRPGPTWTMVASNGSETPCRGVNEGGDADGCKNNPTNQYLAFVFGDGGQFKACGGTGTNGSCGLCNLRPGATICRNN
jgi:hypothetical protein